VELTISLILQAWLAVLVEAVVSVASETSGACGIRGVNRASVVNATFLCFETSKLWVLICIFVDRWKAEGLS
jgi:hypothetical protein